MSDQLTLADFAPAAELPDPEELELRDLARLDGVPDSLFTLLIAKPRKPDLIVQHDCIRQLLADGYTEQDIATATGFNKSAIGRRLRMGTLIPKLRALQQSGRITNSVAEACAKLPESIQHRLAEQAQQNNRHLTARDVNEAKRVRATKASAQLPDSLFATPPAIGAIGVAPDWRPTAAARLAELLSLVPESETETHQAIRAVFQTLTCVRDLDTGEIIFAPNVH